LTQTKMMNTLCSDADAEAAGRVSERLNNDSLVENEVDVISMGLTWSGYYPLCMSMTNGVNGLMCILNDCQKTIVFLYSSE
jgi:hypothetical protein